ncbi:MAG: cation:proton antiporter [Chloroflexi bacterium]|nr:cation:proton antiporter [Chloroflexota bacterium]
MLPFLQLILAIAIIIFAAKLGGYLSFKVGQPAVVGEVLAGLILGPSLIDFFHLSIFTDPHLEESIVHMAELGVLLLMFIAGLELHLEELAKAGKIAFFAGVLGFGVPLLSGYALGSIMGYPLEGAIFLGLLLSPTSISISAQVLMELKQLRTKVGMGLLGGAVIDDVLVVLGLSFYGALLGNSEAIGGVDEVGVIFLKMIGFLIVSHAFGLWVLPKLVNFVKKLPVSQPLISFAFIMLLFYAWSAESLGHMATIIGAFMAGLFFSRSNTPPSFREGFSAIAYGFFVPVFFISIGLEANIRSLNSESLWLLAALLAVAIFSKLLGSGLGGILGGLSFKESAQLGAGMIPRGEVMLIVATVGLVEGIIDQNTFSVVIILVIATTLLAPPILRALFPKLQKAEIDKVI